MSGKPHDGATAHHLEQRGLNLSGLITLALIEEYGSFTRVAEALQVTQPSVSQQIRDLERHAGMPLVQPRGRTVVLTPLGKDLAAVGARIALERDRAAGIAERHRKGIAGSLSIAASMTTSAYVVPRALAQLKAGREDANVELRTANTFDVAEMVANDVVDVGVIEGPIDRPELIVLPFAQDRLVCVARSRHPLAGKTVLPEDARSESMLVREDGSGTRHAVLAALERYHFRFERIVLFGTNESIKAGVANGLGIAWLPEVVVSEELKARTLCELQFNDVQIVREFSIVRRRDWQPTPLGTAFIDILKTFSGEKS